MIISRERRIIKTCLRYSLFPAKQFQRALGAKAYSLPMFLENIVHMMSSATRYAKAWNVPQYIQTLVGNALLTPLSATWANMRTRDTSKGSTVTPELTTPSNQVPTYHLFLLSGTGITGAKEMNEVTISGFLHEGPNTAATELKSENWKEKFWNRNYSPIEKDCKLAMGRCHHTKKVYRCDSTHESIEEANMWCLLSFIHTTLTQRVNAARANYITTPAQ